jgi:hypothetical protein
MRSVEDVVLSISSFYCVCIMACYDMDGGSAMIQGVSFHSRRACVRCLCSIDARFGFVTV